MKQRKIPSSLKTLEYNKIIEMLTDMAVTARGKEIAIKLMPEARFAEAERLLAETQEAFTLMNNGYDIPLGGISDIRESLKRAELGAVLDASELLKIGLNLSAAKNIKNFFNKIPLELQMPILTILAEEIFLLNELENTIESAIDDNGTVKDSASKELSSLRRNIRQAQNQVKDKIDNILRSTEYQKYFQDTLVTMRGDRYVIPIKQEYKHNFPGIIHDQSASGATVFIEPMAVVNLNNNLKQMMLAEKQEVERILRLLSTQVGQHAEKIATNLEILADLDFIFAKAKLARKINATKPILSDKGYLNLIAARHPLLGKDQVVPTDVYLGRDFDILLITGPNTGGKTVTLKTVGLFCLMVKAGLFIPAKTDSIMPIFENIFADIGDEQSIEQSLSTFSSHMTNIVSILNKAKENDLILIDEIGAGTDPSEGAALAMSILEYIKEQKIKAIATTHYSELKTFAYTRDRVENASVEFDLETLRPTYKLLIGTPGSSNAFYISKSLGLNEDLIERAGSLLNKEHADFEKILSSLEEQKRKYTEKLNEIELTEIELNKRVQKISQKELDLKDRQDKAVQKAKEEAAEILRKARYETENLITTLKAQASEDDAKKRQKMIDDTRKTLRNLKDDLISDDDIVNSSGERPINIEPGDNVYIKTLSQKGEVVLVSENDVLVQIGQLKINVALEACQLLNKNQKNLAISSLSSEKKNRNNLKIASSISRQIDIRGLTVEEAVLELDRYIDQALLSNLNEVLIIHGKGTGSLRKGIKTYLEQHPKIKSNRIADLNEGGMGATLALLS
ncbi:endonuclease MutS2 [Selenomonadales bacterium OttesenSCG-928-I06]|nr:endonuclease MutS2 [Selenomonadales bacterium OttesenSCG-928-I06]